MHCGAHQLAGEATEAYEGAGHTVARFIGSADDEVVYTRNTTEGISLVAHARGTSGSETASRPGPRRA